MDKGGRRGRRALLVSLLACFGMPAVALVCVLGSFELDTRQTSVALSALACGFGGALLLGVIAAMAGVVLAIGAIRSAEGPRDRGLAITAIALALGSLFTGGGVLVVGAFLLLAPAFHNG